MARFATLECLESRSLLAADLAADVAVTLDSSTQQLQIEGTQLEDLVIVDQQRNEIVVSSGDHAIARFPNSEVKSIRFLGRGGDDHFENQTSLPTLAYGNRGNDTLVGGSGDDDLHGGPDNDLIKGNAGDDQLHGDYGDDQLHGGDGNDRVLGWYGNDLLTGDDGNDYVSGYKGDDVAFGGDGDDTVKGHEGDDTLYGDGGNDRIYGWKGNDEIFGGDGKDYLSGWSGSDILVGEDGDDRLAGHAGRDLLIGGKGADSLHGGTAADLVISGWTKYDNQTDSLHQILDTWNSDRSLKDRLLMLARGPNGTPELNFKTIKTDGQRDAFLVRSLFEDWMIPDHRDYLKRI